MKDAKQELYDLMRLIFDCGYHAKWMTGDEDLLWHAAISGPRAYGQMEITEEMVTRLRDLSHRSNGWWVLDRHTNAHVFLPLKEWKKRFSPERVRFSLSDVYQDITNSDHAGQKAYCVFDTTCPICRGTAFILRRQNFWEHVTLVDTHAQPDHPLLIAVFKEKKIMLRDGVAIFHKKRIYAQGASTTFFLNQFPNRDFTMPATFAVCFSRIGHIVFPWLHKTSKTP